MFMSETSLKKAIWTPSWYEMDQTIAVGVKNKFWFFQETPEIDFNDEAYDLVFFNQLDSNSNSVVRFANIAEIFHESLGPMVRIDADGLDYIFTPVNGNDILVNAEEEPGKTYEDGVEIDEWSVMVTLVEVSEPMGDRPI